MALFAGNETAFGTHGVPELDPESGLKWTIKSTARTLRGPTTLEMWEAHLKGTTPLGVIPIRTDNMCVWGSIDVDRYDVDLTEIIANVERRKLPLVPCRSKSGGLHLFVFLTEPTPAAVLLPTLRDIAASLGLASSEIFPKQTQILSDRGDLGNWMVMPYYGDTFGGKLQEQVGLRNTGNELSDKEFLKLAEQSKVDPPALVSMAQARKAPTRKANGKAEPAGPFSDGPPCLQHLAAQGVPKGGQNNTLLQMGIYFKKKNPQGWKEDLEHANSNYLDPPGSAEGLMQVVQQLSKKDYQYTCKTEPMCSHCDSSTCITRVYGVGEEGNFPRITGISKLNIDPPLWFVDVGDQRLEVTTEDLQNYMRFHKVCMERLNRVYRVMKQDTWWGALNSAMANVTLIESSADVGEGERFRELLEEFLVDRQRGTQKEDLLSGRPWEDTEHGRHYFRLRNLQEFLTREGLRDYPRNRIARRLEALGGGHGFFNIKNRNGLNVWWVPSSIVNATPEIPLPKQPEKPA